MVALQGRHRTCPYLKISMKKRLSSSNEDERRSDAPAVPPQLGSRPRKQKKRAVCAFPRPAPLDRYAPCPDHSDLQLIPSALITVATPVNLTGFRVHSSPAHSRLPLASEFSARGEPRLTSLARALALLFRLNAVSYGPDCTRKRKKVKSGLGRSLM